MTVDRIQDEVRADDPIQKFQGRWIGSDGWEFPVHARYVAWGIFGFVLPLVLLGDWLITGGISPLPLIDIMIAVGLTSALANLTSGEVSLGHALVYITRTVRAARDSRRRSPRTRASRLRPRRITRRPPPQLDQRRSTTKPDTTKPAMDLTIDGQTSKPGQTKGPVTPHSAQSPIDWPAPTYGPAITTNSAVHRPPDRVASAQTWGSAR